MATANLRDRYRDTMIVLTGEFDGRVIEAEVGKSTAGNDMIKFKLQIEGGKHHGKSFPDNATLSDNAVRMFFEKLAPMGLGSNFFDVPEGQEPPSLEDTAREMVGRPCRFVLVKDSWQGREREKVQRILPPREGVKRTAPAAATSNGVPAGVPDIPAPAPAPAPSPAPASTPNVTPPPDLKLPEGTDPPF